MTARERDALVRELEVEHRTAVADAARMKRDMRQMAADLEAKEKHIREVADGISILRGTY